MFYIEEKRTRRPVQLGKMNEVIIGKIGEKASCFFNKAKAIFILKRAKLDKRKFRVIESS